MRKPFTEHESVRDALIDAVEELSEWIDNASEEKKRLKSELWGVVDGAKKYFEGVAIRQAFKAVGIEWDGSEPINQWTLTAAINRDILGGDIEFRNLFDADTTKKDLMRIAANRAAESAGIDIGAGGLDDIKNIARALVAKEVRAQLEQGGGELIDGAESVATVLRIIKSTEVKEVELIDTAKAAKNRERQARYRATHKRYWVAI